jgi:hypothetical protein
MSRTIIATLTGVALILFAGTLPLASAAPAPSTFHAPVVEAETYPAPVAERDSFEVSAAPGSSRPCLTPAAPRLPRCNTPTYRPYEGDATVEKCRAALNGYVICTRP